MSYIIAIPSYKRSIQLQNKTLTTLYNCNIPKQLINIFVIEEEYQEYLDTLNKDYYNKLIVGNLGLVQQREFIQNYYPIGSKIISLDDDIEDVDLSLTTYKCLDEFFEDAFATCEKEKAFIWSVYPVFNKFFREKRPELSTCLTFLIGAFYGYINRNDTDLKLTLTREGNKEDVERSILYWLKDNKTLRFNKIGFKTKYYGVGGLGGLKERLDTMKKGSILINEKYPLYTRIKIRKNGLYEIVFIKEKLKPINIKIDPSRDDILEIYNLLEFVNVPLLSNKMGRSKTFGNHRSMTLGIVKARISRKYALSYYTKKYPELYEMLMKFGKTIVPFNFNAIHINHNVVCPRHLDAHNVGKSCLVSFGDYEGCNLIVEGYGEYNTNCSPIIFDGSKLYHYNTPLISGNKYSLVFFIS